MTVVEKKFQYGGREVSLQTGLLARQADAAVLLQVGKLQLLATVVVDRTEKENSFFPLSVHFISKAYAHGKIPGGFKRREGPPIESDVLTSRLIDRPIRPLFPAGFMQEVQVVVTLLSDDPEVTPDIYGIIAASAAIRLAGLPVEQSIAGVRLGLDARSNFVINPAVTPGAELDLVVAGHGSAILMVECCSSEVPEDRLAAALIEAEKVMGEAVTAIDSFVDLVDCANPHPHWEAPEQQEKILVDELLSPWKEQYLSDLQAAKFDKNKRLAVIDTAQKKLVALAQEQYPGTEEELLTKVAVKALEQLLRETLLEKKVRLDGRAPEEIRPIDIQVGFLHQAHGSALFTRGSTQSLTSLTLGGGKDAQMVEHYDGKEHRDPFMLHYNFPPYSVGDIGMLGSPKRREIGHGRLARRALENVLPAFDKFPYVVRVVSEILESDGSSSMATVCASALALMDAGVPLKRPVAGIAMGLMQSGDQHVVLSDICGEEDAFGDMDFKVAGTTEGVTALQMDMKIQGVSAHIMATALEQARQGRLEILKIMGNVLPHARKELAAHAPRIETMTVRTDQIREVIGKGGATIKMLTELSGAALDIQDDGTVQIVAADQQQADKAKDLIKQVISPLIPHQIYEGQVTKMLDFGFVVGLMSGKEGLVHISECPFPSEELSSQIRIGQRLKVKLVQYDQGSQKIRFSLKQVPEL